MKRGRKPLKSPEHAKRHCSRCGVGTNKNNAYLRADGTPTSYCKACNVKVSIIKAWRGKSHKERLAGIKRHEDIIKLIQEADGYG